MAEHQKTETVVNSTYTCDGSGFDGDTCGVNARYHCHICTRDMCATHTVQDPRDTGDYPRNLCFKCSKIGEPFLAKMKVIEEESDKAMGKLEEKWYEAAEAARDMAR